MTTTRIGWLLAAAVAMWLPAASRASACDTPVYRYAMYQWQATPYEVYFFHEADPSESHRQVQAAFEQLDAQADRPTNVRLISVDLRDDEALSRLPPDVRRRWQERDEPGAPAYLIVSPQGGLVAWSELTAETIPALADSPARQAVARELAAAKAGVFVLLTNGDPAASTAAEQEVRGVAKQLEAGELPLYQPLIDPLASPEPQADSGGQPPRVAVVKVRRDDPAERWFVDSLLAVEADLRELDRPMVFPVYGRGRALPPYVGAGITSGNLAEAVAFVTGACSCTVKDQNPGVDLLISYDWETAADAMKEKFGAEEGNETFGESDILPQLILPGETGPDAQADSTDQPLAAGEPKQPAADEAAQRQVALASRGVHEAHAEEHDATHGNSASHAAAGGHDRPFVAFPGGDDGSRTLFYALGFGVGLGVLLLAGVTLLMFRGSS